MVPEKAETVRLCTAQGIEYRAYRRPYNDGPAQVLNLFASCYYGDAPHEIFFATVPGRPGSYRLMEKLPGSVYPMLTYYTACFSSGIGLPELANTVTIEDAYGQHVVKVESLEA